jgi:CBS domain containing-hemolysin-like protein
VVVVVDEHGSAVGLAFLEDALEEIVGPLRDEFDEDEVQVQKAEDGSVRLAGGLALPKAIDMLGLGDVEADTGAETIAGLVTARLGRLPQKGDSVSVGPYVASVEKVSRRRIVWLRFTPAGERTNGRDA